MLENKGSSLFFYLFVRYHFDTIEINY